MLKIRESINKLFLPECSISAIIDDKKAEAKDSSVINDRNGDYACGSLNDAELITAVSGIKQELAVEILRQYMLHEVGDYLEGLKNLRITSKQKKAILSAFELSKRIYGCPAEKQWIIKSPLDVVSFLEGDLRHIKKEVFMCLHLNTKNAVLRKEAVSVGSLNASIVHPREVFANAVKHSASGVILCHNHPSGDPEASIEDIDTTSRLVEAGNVLGIKVLDHVIIGDGRYFSLKEKALM